MKFLNLKISQKLTGGFILVALIGVLVGIIGIINLKKLAQNSINMFEESTVPLEEISKAAIFFQRIRVGVMDFLDAENIDETQELQTKIEQQWKEMVDHLGNYEKSNSSDSEIKLLDEIKYSLKELRPMLDNILRLASSNQRAEAKKIMKGEGYIAFTKVRESFEKCIETDSMEAKELADENNKTAGRSVTILIIVILIGFTVAVGLGLSITRLINKPLSKLVILTMMVAEGDLSQPAMEVPSRDEIGNLIESINKLVKNLKQNFSIIAVNSNSLSTSSEELSVVSTEVTALSTQTANQANTVSAASEQVSRNIQTVATASEEMNASFREIAKNTSEAAKVATSAVQLAHNTNEIISKLGESSNQIGQVIKVITSIAQQTNLLALNATIEAARAGDAGKGFAVVANEVKELAKETAKATEDIGKKIEMIQGDTKEAVEAIGQISQIINHINDIQNAVASAVEEQVATTNEIGRNVAEAAKGSREISHNIHGVAEAAKSTNSGSGDTQKAASELAKMAIEMQKIVSQFKI